MSFVFVVPICSTTLWIDHSSRIYNSGDSSIPEGIYVLDRTTTVGRISDVHGATTIGKSSPRKRDITRSWEHTDLSGNFGSSCRLGLAEILQFWGMNVWGCRGMDVWWFWGINIGSCEIVEVGGAIQAILYVLCIFWGANGHRVTPIRRSRLFYRHVSCARINTPNTANDVAHVGARVSLTINITSPATYRFAIYRVHRVHDIASVNFIFGGVKVNGGGVVTVS